MMNNAVKVAGLRVTRGRVAVFDGFDVAVRQGAITGLLGPSGCGKTTLLRSIVGVQRIAAGTITVLGAPAGSRALRRRVAYATQAASVYDDLTVRQNLQYFSRVLGAPTGDVQRVIDQVELGPYSRQRIASLSGGQRSRVSLATAMLGTPGLLVLDEPTVGLDPLLRENLWSIFRSLADSGVTVIVSSHVMDEALRCDDLILLRDGALVAHTTPAGLLEQTGATNPDDAFLTLIERAGRAA
ncbi:ABC-2 type transport system ATP-binding protein [Microbacteriaceae bacterium SG_E_30_P1]|uniref:ABC-2 type transport system ATP-binding protein n=1 Tax=Antiquaquibacter oligotrophicus TaxID=2880260 RepID=A0ABT6KQK8_9MICO|nr:ABC transporter ATP-binding protein [Antiquaquibacter oligotrophicus]MDH6182271.1 ABC-2 type transport system ATP-binding protein [Antiquaquibacter oligotrophicus]UDF12072.1 ABC transporter ATP-binding protein [Antiquaquibacter oligotrophicus]